MSSRRLQSLVIIELLLQIANLKSFLPACTISFLMVIFHKSLPFLLYVLPVQAACPVWINPCAIGQPTLTSDQHPFRCHQGAPCSSGFVCPHTNTVKISKIIANSFRYYCHIGFDESTTACCPSQGDPCSLIVKEGRGSHSIQRWFYNQKTRQCQPFTYKG